MESPKKLFCDHPQSVGETYFQHMRSAGSFALAMTFGALVCLVHAILPFAFKATGSRLIEKLHRRMVAARHRADGCVDLTPAK